MIKKLQGVTLLEAMLAFAIASSILTLAIKQYSQYKFARDSFALKYSVDGLFQGLRNYYYVNCAESTDTNMNLHTLAPSRSPANPYSVDTTKLAPYVDANWHPSYFLIDTSFADGGYATQFNNITSTNMRNENFCYYYPNTTQTSPICASLPNLAANVSIWVAQVVVKIKDPNLTLAIKSLTNATCALDSFDAGSVVDCSSGATSGAPAYLVWQRLPSFAAPEMSSGLWRTTFNVKEFNLQYTNDSYWDLVSGEPANYLCGG